MFASGHRKFGEVFIEHYDLPIDKEWARAPDYGIYFEDSDVNKYLHRFTLHGMDNVEYCIKKIREKGLIEYDDDYKDEIRCLVVSHTFLDLFNFLIFPSYPKCKEFKFIPKQLRRYPIVALDDPDNLDILFECIINRLNDSDSLKLESKMRVEYDNLPWKSGELINEIVEHYEVN